MTPYIILGFFLLGTLALGLWAGKDVKTLKDYVLANRSLSGGTLAMTFLATFIGAGDLETVGWIYFCGIISHLEVIGYSLVGGLLGYWIIPKLVYFAECITIGDVMHRLYGEPAKIFSSLIAGLVCTFIASGQILMLLRLNEDLLGLDASHFLLITMLVISVYIISGGIRAVAFTDIVQFVALVVIIAWVANVAVGRVGGVKVLLDSVRIHYPDRLRIYADPDFGFYVQQALFWGFFPTMFLTPPFFQRMLMAKNKRQVRNMFLGTITFYPILRLLLTLIAFAGLVLELDLGADMSIARSESVLSRIIRGLFASEFARSVIMIGLVSVILSTIDSFLHAAGVTLVHDVIQPLWRGKIKREITWMKVATLLLSLLGCGFVLVANISPGRIVSYGLCAFSLFIVPLVAGIIGFRTHARLFWGSLACALVGPVLFGIVQYSLLARLATHTLSECMLRNTLWLVAVSSGALGFFVLHYIHYGRFTFVSGATRSPQGGGFGKRRDLYAYFREWLAMPMQLVAISRKRLYAYGGEPVLFAWFVCIFYMLPSLEGGVAGYAMVGLRACAVVLCCGLLVQDVWPTMLRPYFALYWFFTLLYCLPFTGMLLFFAHPESMTSIVMLAVTFLLLIVCVDWQSFVVLSSVGSVVAMMVYRVCSGCFVPSVSFDMGWNLAITLGSVLLIGLFFARRQQGYTRDELQKAKLYAGSIASETKSYLGVSSFAGHLMNRSIADGRVKFLEKEGVYAMPKELYDTLAFVGQELEQGAKQSAAKVDMFLQALRQDVFSAKLEYCSMKSCVESALSHAYFKDKDVQEGLVLKLRSDFSARVHKGFFKHVLYNLVKNAYYHGGATEVSIILDATRRSLCIEDNGQGIEAVRLPYIFDLFYSRGGSGIGLGFVKVMVEACGGSIQCVSRRGKKSFTRFVLTFPRA